MKLIIALGYAGLLPFVLLPVAFHMGWVIGDSPLLTLYQLYSALILGFMAGVLWPVLYLPEAAGKQQIMTKDTTLALLAVSFPVLSISSLALLPEYFLLVQACLFLLLRVAEFDTRINALYSRNYRSLRNALTLVVVISHLLMFALTGW